MKAVERMAACEAACTGCHDDLRNYETVNLVAGFLSLSRGGGLLACALYSSFIVYG